MDQILYCWEYGPVLCVVKCLAAFLAFTCIALVVITKNVSKYWQMSPSRGQNHPQVRTTALECIMKSYFYPSMGLSNKKQSVTFLYLRQKYPIHSLWKVNMALDLRCPYLAQKIFARAQRQRFCVDALSKLQALI